MFEKVALRTAHTFYALAIGLGVIALTWVCLANLPLWAAVLAFGIALPLLASVVSPLAAGGAILVGTVVGLLTLIADSSARRFRHGG